MSVLILATGIAQPSSVENILQQPAFRKATRNMALAYAAVVDLLSALPNGWLSEHAATLATVLGTGDGELDVTVRFLRVFGGGGMARPFLFQSSLHNATLGFLSERFGWRGPGATVCGYDTSGEEALETAMDWALIQQSPFAIAIGVDGVVEGSGHAPFGLREGAGAVLLARPGSTCLPALATFEGWDSLPGTGEASAPFYQANCSTASYYHASAVEQLARVLRETPESREVRRRSPNGVIHRLHLGRP